MFYFYLQFKLYCTRERISPCKMNPLESHVCFLCFQEYDASVIVTSPNVPYKGACSYELDRLRKFAYSEPRESFFNFAFLF